MKPFLISVLAILVAEFLIRRLTPVERSMMPPAMFATDATGPVVSADIDANDDRYPNRVWAFGPSLLGEPGGVEMMPE